MQPPGRSDGATDLAIGLLLAVGAACWAGLIAGQLGHFGLAPVLAAAAVGAAAPVRALRGAVRAADPPSRAARWGRGLDGPLVFVLAALLYLPGYDTTLYGSDATVYLATGAHLARTGSLAIDEPLLWRFPPRVQRYVFPAMAAVGGSGQGPFARSVAGLVYDGLGPPIYSTFSQLPSVWMAIGFAGGGLAGARSAGPLLAAAALAVFYLLVRRTTGAAVAVVAAALLGPAIPQVMFARLSMGECGAQFFLWAGLLACARFYENGARIAAVAAGLGFGLAGLARPEYIAFVPLGVAVWSVLPGERRRLPASTVILAALLFLHGLALVLLVVPSHYRHALRDALQTNELGGAPPAAIGVVAFAAVLALAGAVALAWREGRATGLREAVLPILAAWVLAWVSMSSSPSLGQALAWLPFYTAWPVLLLAAAGIIPLVRRWWPSPAAGLAFVLAAVAAAHFFFDPRTAPFPFWAARRFVPMVLPVLFAAAATAAVLLVRPRGLVVAVAGIAIAANVWHARPALRSGYFAGASAVAADVASLVPPGALVVLDPSLRNSLLDVPLLLLHDRDAVQMSGPPGAAGRILAAFTIALPDVPLYYIHQTALAPAPFPHLRFEAVGGKRTTLLIPGIEYDGRAFASLVDVRVLRVFLERS